MIFASRTPESLNHDPYPNVWDGHSPRDQMRADTDMFRKGAPVGVMFSMTYLHRPRPEYTPTTTHPANPILVAFRDDLNNARDPERDSDVIADWINAANGDASGLAVQIPPATSEQITHARRVLTRLAAWQE